MLLSGLDYNSLDAVILLAVIWRTALIHILCVHTILVTAFIYLCFSCYILYEWDSAFVVDF